MSDATFSQTLEHWQSLGLRCFLASFLVMIATWLVYLCLSNYSAALRHRVLFLGLGGMTMLPILVMASQRICPVLQVANQNDLTKTEPFVNHAQYDTTQFPSSPPEFSPLQIAEMEEVLATVTSLAPSETAFLKDASPKRVAQLRVVVLGKYGDQSIGKVLAQDELVRVALGDTVKF